MTDQDIYLIVDLMPAPGGKWMLQGLLEAGYVVGLCFIAVTMLLSALNLIAWIT